MVAVLYREFGNRKVESITSQEVERWITAYEGSKPDAAEVPRLPRLDLQAGKEGLRADEDDQDAAVFLTAAFAGLRMGELVALRWRDVDFARRTIHVRDHWALRQTTTPKGGGERAIPMAEEVATRLAQLG